MPARSYLSIGQVLDLLKHEFPDLTISKIRFLESQGLLDPERTPSGYRKFYEPDVDRLRFILRAQQEHYLPLKVIRGRLGMEPDGVDGDDPCEESDDAGEFGGDRVAVEGRDPGAEGASADDVGGRRASIDDIGGEDGPRASEAALPSPPTVATGAAGGTGSTAPDSTAPDSSAPGSTGTGSTATGSTGTGSTAAGLTAARSAAARSTAAGSPPVLELVAPDEGDEEREPVTMTLDELAAASGLSVGEVAELERFGLLSGRQIVGRTYYDADCIEIACVAAAFRAFGVEARHLRMYRTAVEREAGFFEQVVTPMLKQRNPQARRQAVETLLELGRLGHAIRAAFLRQALRGYTGGP